MHQVLFPKTLEHYGEEVRFVYKDYPLTEIHPWAMHAAINANCLATQNAEAYWKYLDYVHSHGQEINGGEERDLSKSFAALDSITEEEGLSFKLDTLRLKACVQMQDDMPIRASMKEAEAFHIQGTPLLIVDGEPVSGGAVSADQIWLVIDRALHAAGIESQSVTSRTSGP